MKLMNEVAAQEIDVITESKSVELTYAIRDESIVHISEVEQGLSCDCQCPHCGSALVARKGNIRAHHFAHHNSPDCNHGMETALHMLAKEIIKTEKCLYLPSDCSNSQLEDRNGRSFKVCHYLPSASVQFDEVRLEQHSGDYTPDVTALTTDGKWLDIEILVTHKVDENKAMRQRMRGKDMIEIDLSELARDLSRQELTKAVLLTAPRHFIHNAYQSVANIQLKSSLTETVAYIDNLIEMAKHNSFAATSSNEVVLMGFKSGSGYSHKTKRDFKVCHLFYSRPAQKHNTGNFNLHSSGGFELETYNVDESLIPALQTLTFPVRAKLNFSYDNGMSRMTKRRVIGFTIIA